MNIRYSGYLLLICFGFVILSLPQKCRASVLNDKVELGQPKGEYHVHYGADPVNLKNGNLYYPATDLSIPGMGFPLEIKRNYNSRSYCKGIFGFGWSSNCDANIIYDQKGTIRIIEEDGSISHYSKSANTSEAQDLFFSLLNSDDTVIKKPDGTYRRIRGSELVEYYLPDGRLSLRKDKYNNSIKFNYENGRLSSIENNSGRALRFTTNTHGLITEISDPLGRSWRYGYDAKDNLISFIMPGEIKYSFEYDKNHNLTAIFYPDGTSTKMSYDIERDVVIEMKGPGRRKTQYQYYYDVEEPRELKTSVTDGNGNKTTYTYLPMENSRKLTITDPLGGNKIKVFDESDNLIKLIDENGHATVFRYDDLNRLISKTDAVGNTWRFEYVEECRCNRFKRAIDPDSKSVSVTYNAIFQPKSITDRAGRTVYSSYTPFGAIKKIWDASGYGVTLSYDIHGDLISEKDSRDNTKQYRYDVVGRLIETTEELTGATTITYDDQDNILNISRYDLSLEYNYDNMGRVTLSANAGDIVRYTYNHEGLIAKSLYYNGIWESYSYDPAGNVTKIKESPDMVTVYDYDGNNKLVQLKDPMNNIRAFKYDPAGNLVQSIDQTGRIERFVYDRANRLAEYINQGGDLLKITTDWGNRVVRREDGLGNMIAHTYNDNGQIIETIDSSERETFLGYTDDGLLSRVIDGNFNITEFYYDRFNNIENIIVNEKEILIVYDEPGKPAEIMDPDYPISVGYNKKGQLEKVGFPLMNMNLQLAYYSNGLRSDLKGPNDYHIHSTYNNLRQLTQIDGLGVRGVRFVYDSAGRKARKIYGNGIIAEYSYDNRNRVIALVYTKPAGQVLYRFQHHFDETGRCIFSTDGERHHSKYHYSPSGRLDKIENADETTTMFSYDAGGNRIREEVVSSDSKLRKIVKYKYNPGNRLLKCGDDRFSYDDEGNVISKASTEGLTRFIYDGQNRLMKVLLPDNSIIEYKHDLFGRRVFRKEGITEYHYIYEAEDLIAVYDKKMTLVLQIVHGQGIDEPLYIKQGGNIFYFVYDGLGNVVATTDENGEVVQEYFSGSFGLLSHKMSKADHGYAFQARRYDLSTGLYYFRNREYDPGTGRFLQPDPVEPGLNLNLYAFAENDPINMMDPFGLRSQSKTVLLAAKKGTPGYEYLTKLWQQRVADKKSKERARAEWAEWNKKVQQHKEQGSLLYTPEGLTALKNQERAKNNFLRVQEIARVSYESYRNAKTLTRKVPGSAQLAAELSILAGKIIFPIGYNKKTGLFTLQAIYKPGVTAPGIGLSAGVSKGGTQEQKEGRISVEYGPLEVEIDIKTGKVVGVSKQLAGVGGGGITVGTEFSSGKLNVVNVRTLPDYMIQWPGFKQGYRYWYQMGDELDKVIIKIRSCGEKKK